MFESRERFSTGVIEAQIARIVDALPGLGERLDGINSLLLKGGCDPFLAAQLSDFFPEACGYALLKDSGVTLADEYTYLQVDGAPAKGTLSSDRVWQILVRRIEILMTDEHAHTRLATPAACSAIFHAANSLVLAGSKLADLTCAMALGSWPRN